MIPIKIKNISILYVENDLITKEQFSEFLKSQCKILYTASNGEEGLKLFKQFNPDIVITDIEMPIINGLEMAKKIREVSLSTQIIIITAYQKTEYLLEAVNLQLTQYIIKPLSLAKIINALELTLNFLDSSKIKTTKSFSDNKYYDTYSKELISENQIINLSKYERSLLELLIKKYPAPLSYELIDSDIYNFGSTKNAIKLLISSLRDKIDRNSIINISGFGYKLNFME